MKIRKTDVAVREEMQAWFRECLGCVAGRREFALGRYAIEVIGDTDASSKILDAARRFRRSLLAYESVACVLVFNNPKFYADAGTATIEAISFLAQQIAPLACTTPERLIAGGRIRQRHAIKCPVTGAPRIFDDFDAIAFCPQAENKKDPLYDPLMAAPYPCVNISSDVFAFSMFTRDRFLDQYKSDILAARLDDVLRDHMSECSALWQKLALRTVRNYIAMTDTTLCPTYLSGDQRYWFASHQDPAFAESEKRIYRHEMPSVYTPQIIDDWKRRLEGRSSDRSGTASTKHGEPL